MNLLTKPVLTALAALLALSVLWGGWQWRGKLAAQGNAAQARLALSDYRREAADNLARFQAEARQQEHRHAADMARIERETRDRLKEEGDAAYNRAVADVRAGRLRGPWTCPAPGVPGTGDPAAERDGAGDDRAEAVGRVLRIGAEADARLRACQAVIESDRS